MMVADMAVAAAVANDRVDDGRRGGRGREGEGEGRGSNAMRRCVLCFA
jgi:hypothetical protein